MAEEKFIRYGDKTMPMEGLTLDQAKELMARHFPELAEPRVETKKDGDKTIYIFSKQAGRKGSGLSLVTRRLAALEPAQPVSEDALDWALALRGPSPVELEGDSAQMARELQNSAQQVASVYAQLLDIEPQVQASGAVLL